ARALCFDVLENFGDDGRGVAVRIVRVRGPCVAGHGEHEPGDRSAIFAHRAADGPRVRDASRIEAAARIGIRGSAVVGPSGSVVEGRATGIVADARIGPLAARVTKLVRGAAPGEREPAGEDGEARGDRNRSNQPPDSTPAHLAFLLTRGTTLDGSRA